MSLSDFAKTFDDGTIILKDGTATPVGLTLSYDRGDLSVSGWRPTLNTVEFFERRGKFVSAGHTERVYVSVSFSVIVTGWLAGATPGSAAAFMLKAGDYTGNVSTFGAGRPYAFDLEHLLEGTDYGDASDHDFTLHDCVPDSVDYEESNPCAVAVSMRAANEVSGDFSLDEVA